MTTTTPKAKARRRNSTPQPKDTGSGLRCPKCGGAVKVLHTSATGHQIRRRRECRNCGNRFATIEAIEGNSADLATAAARQLERIEQDHRDNLHAMASWLREIATGSG